MKAEVTFEQIVAAALLKFSYLDPVDIHLLLEDLEQSNLVYITACLPINHLHSYIKYSKQGGIFSLQDHLTLDTFLADENCKVFDIFSNFTKSVLENYIQQLDISSFENRKKKYLEETKKKLFDHGEVLLISDLQEDYDALVKYGFLNIKLFKSVVLAEEFFKKYPEQLQKYHLIFEGGHSLEWLYNHSSIELSHSILKQKYENSIVEVRLIWKNNLLTTYCEDYETLRNWYVCERDYSKLFDHVVENAFINRILSCKKSFKDVFLSSFSVKPLLKPSLKSDLKILYLPYYLKENDQFLATDLGLDITVLPNLEEAFTHLGEYDIILASHLFSSSLFDMIVESNEQGRRNGREHSLLLTYEEGEIVQIDEDGVVDLLGFGNEVHLQYVFNDNNTILQEKFRVLRKEALSFEKAIMQAAVSLYNQSLAFSLKDLDFKQPHEYTEEYQKREDEEQMRIKEALRPLQLLGEIRLRIENYLWYKKEGFISEEPKDLQIFAHEDTIAVIMLQKKRILSNIIFPRHVKTNSLAFCSISSFKENEKLGGREIVGLYTRKYEKLEDLPPKPTESQLNILEAISKKTAYSLDPLNEKAELQCIEREKNLAIEQKAIPVLI